MVAADSRAPTLVDILGDWAESDPEAIAFTFLLDGEQATQSITYRQLDRSARRIAHSLRRLAGPRESVVLLYPDGLDFVAGLFGCLYAGVVAVSGVSPHAPRSVQRFTNVVRDSKAGVVLGARALCADFQRALHQGPGPLDLKWLAADAVDAHAADDWWRPPITFDSVALVQYTSGSTGTPRGVVLSHGNLLHNLSGQQKAFNYDRSDSGVSWLPFAHDMGLIGGVLMAVYCGRPCVLMSPVHFLEQPVRWLRAISRFKATISGGPNFAYDLCVRRIDAAQKIGLSLGHWKIAFNGAETVRPETLKSFSEAFADCGFRPQALYPCYGLAEATLFVSGGAHSALPTTRTVSKEYLARNRAVEVDAADGSGGTTELASCGYGMQGQQIAIVQPQARTRCEDGEIGEIWIAGPSVAQGYHNGSDETRARFRAFLQSGEGPYLRTGDLAFRLNGELFVTGRLNDLIVIRGANYYPQDIEFAAERSHPALRQNCSAAFSVDDAGAEALAIVGELAHGEAAAVEQVIAAIRRAIAEEFGLATHAVVLVRAGTLPKTPSGKLQRGQCRDAYATRRLAVIREWRLTADGASAVSLQRVASRPKKFEDIERWFRERLRAFGVDVTQMRPETHLAELGVDSLKIVELRSEIEREFGIPILVADLYQLGDLRGLADYILARCWDEPEHSAALSHAPAAEVQRAPERALDRVTDGKNRLRAQRAFREDPTPTR